MESEKLTNNQGVEIIGVDIAKTDDMTVYQTQKRITSVRGNRNKYLYVTSSGFYKYLKEYKKLIKLLNQLSNTKRYKIKKKIKNRINKLKESRV